MLASPHYLLEQKSFTPALQLQLPCIVVAARYSSCELVALHGTPFLGETSCLSVPGGSRTHSFICYAWAEEEFNVWPIHREGWEEGGGTL